MGGGGGFAGFSSLNPLKWNSEDWAHGVLGGATRGLIGLGQDGRLGLGSAIKGASDGLAEVTGVAAMTRQMEAEMQRAEARAIEEKENLSKLRDEELLQRQRDDVAASSRAQTYRSFGANQGNFLGL